MRELADALGEMLMGAAGAVAALALTVAGCALFARSVLYFIHRWGVEPRSFAAAGIWAGALMVAAVILAVISAFLEEDV